MLDRIAGVRALFAPTNKGKKDGGGDQTEGPVSDLLPELQLDMDDETLLSLAKDWTAAWDKERQHIDWKQKLLEKYWLGTQAYSMDSTGDTTQKPTADNCIFEALETFIPKATQKSPDPVVTADGSTLGQATATLTEKMLAHAADLPTVRLKMALRQAVRHNQLYFVGAIKTGWSLTDNDVCADVIRPQRLILDPDCTVEHGRYGGSRLGIHCEDSAADLIQKFPDKKDVITEMANSKLGTKMGYIEWWSAGEEPAVFWTMETIVLGKMRNPHFNYPQQQTQTDEFGNETPTTVGGHNYFKRPEIPVTLLVTTNVGKKPYDTTNALFQCVAMQDVVTKRWKQIDENVGNMNGSIIASLDYFEEGQAAQAAQAMRAGDVMLQPKGIAGEGIKRDPGQSLPVDVFANLQDARQRILSVYGISGSVPSGLQRDKTVRGKMITRGADDDRIGGGIGEHLELFAARIYEQLLQLMYVYYDEPKIAGVLGKEKAMEYFAISKGDLQQAILTVTVRDGSMVPKDAMTRRQEAIDLWGANGIDPISFYEALDFPNPRESAKSLFLWQTNPASLFPELMGAAPAQGAAPTAGGGVSPPAAGGDSGGNPSTALPLTPLPQ